MKLGCFAAAAMTCLFAFPTENPGCEFESTRFNMAFFYVCIITETVLRILFQFLFVTNDYESMQKRQMFLKGF